LSANRYVLFHIGQRLSSVIEFSESRFDITQGHAEACAVALVQPLNTGQVATEVKV